MKYKKILHNGKLVPITAHPLFAIYHGIKNRCYNKNLPTYDRWGGRGIRMSKAWYNSFEQFVKDMGERPSKKHSIDRIDNNKGYNKLNCRWATAKEQGNNQRTNIKIEYDGNVRSLAETAEYINIPYHTLYHYFVVLQIRDIDLIINFLKHRKAKKLTSTDLKKIRSVYHLIQNHTCPILKQKYPENNMVVDHLHTKHANLLNLDYPGCVRGIIHRQANSFEGKIVNLMIRLGLHKFDISLPQLLRNTADYLERPPMPFIHPNEVPREPKLTKISYNRLKKKMTSLGKTNCPCYPKSGKLTVPLKKCFDLYEIIPEFYGGRANAK